MYTVSALLHCVPHQSGSPSRRNFQKPQSHCTCYRTPFEQNTFYQSIKSCLPSGVNDYQIKLRRKTCLPLLHAGLQSRTTIRNSLEGSQQDKRDHFQLGHHKISHCNNFIYKTLTNIKQGEQISNTTEITHMASSLRATVQMPGETVPTRKMGQLCNYLTL